MPFRWPTRRQPQGQMLLLELGFLRPTRWIHCSRTNRRRECTVARCNIRQVSKDSRSAGIGGGGGGGDNILDQEPPMHADLPDLCLSQDKLLIRRGDASAAVDFYTFLMKQGFPGFLTAMVAAPVLLSVIFTLLYVPAFGDLRYGEEAFGELTAMTVFQIFMFSVSLCTGLEPEVSPSSPYTMVLANVNALMAQLLFVFLSGAVFQRLAQPSEPIQCSSVAIISREIYNSSRVLMARFVLTGPQPCELVDVKIELSLWYTSGNHHRDMESLKLVRKTCFYLNYGMLVRHVIDEQSPLHSATPEILIKQDAVISLGVVGIERSSMQSVFHIEHYSARDGHIIWDAKFNDMILINKNKSVRVVDHSRLSSWH